MNKTNLDYQLALMHTPKLKLTDFYVLLEKFPDLSELFDLQHNDLVAIGLNSVSAASIKKPPWQAVEQDLAWENEDNNHHIITMQDALYPVLLHELPNKPPLLFAKGDPQLLNEAQLAIVGSRNPSPNGLRTANAFATELCQAGLIITSGMALGLDAASHRATLNAGSPTIAVLGTGIDVCYPRSHRELAKQIAQHGVLVTEFVTGTQPRAAHFPQRNRIVSGLCLGTLVVEATLRSGSLITARLACEQGREVYAIPGSIHNPLKRGCHALINQGAKLVETVSDILAELPPLTATLNNKNQQKQKVTDVASLSSQEKKLLRSIDTDTTALDTILQRSQLTNSEVAAMLLLLELQGFIYKVPGGYCRSDEVN